MGIIEIRDLWKSFGNTVALKDINLSIEENEFRVFVGPNGSGKTTLLKLICGLLKPSKGYINVFNLIPWRQRHDIFKRTGFALEDLTLPWWTTARDYLRFISLVKNIEWSNVERIAEYFDVADYWRENISKYSSGMRKKIILIQALIGDPDLVILDEPLTLLDRPSIDKLIDYLEDLKGSKTILIASHYLYRLKDMASRITVILGGELASVSSYIPLQ